MFLLKNSCGRLRVWLSIENFSTFMRQWKSRSYFNKIKKNHSQNNPRIVFDATSSTVPPPPNRALTASDGGSHLFLKHFVCKLMEWDPNSPQLLFFSAPQPKPLLSLNPPPSEVTSCLKRRYNVTRYLLKDASSPIFDTVKHIWWHSFSMFVASI